MIRKLGNWAFGVVAAVWLTLVAIRTRGSQCLRVSVVSFLLVAAAHAQGVLMQLPPVTDSLGRPIAGATVAIFTASGTLPNVTCNAPVTVYKDAALSVPFTTLTTDGFGNFPFYIAPAANPYGYTITGSGTATTQCYVFSAPFTFGTVFTGNINGSIGTVLCLNSDTGLDRNAPAWWNMGNCTPGDQSGTLSLSLLFSNQQYIAAGSAAAPSHAFKTDSSTGSYLAAPGTYGIAASGSEVATFSAAGVSAGILNGIVKAEKQPGATLDVQLNNCVTAAQAKAPHICDAQNAGNGQIAAQVNVGDNATATPVTLWLPTAATWTSTIANGTSCAIMVHEKGNMIGDPAGQGIDMKIVNAATGNVDSLVCTDPAPIGGGSYGHIGGFLVQNALGGTVVTAALNVQKTFDNFLAERITANCQGCVGVYTHNLCCNLVMRGIQSDGSSVAGSKPCVVGKTGENTRGIHFADALNCVHPGNGNNALLVQGDSTWTENIAFDTVYIEPDQADTTTTLAQISAGGPITFEQIHASNFGALPTNYLLDVAATNGNGKGFFVKAASVPTGGNAINDHVHSATITGTLNQTVGPYGWGEVGSQIYQTKLVVANNADADLTNTINCGATTTKTCTLDFLDQGIPKFSIQKNGINQLVLFNSAATIGQLVYNSAGNATYNAPTGQSHAFEINGSVVSRVNGSGFTSTAYLTSTNCSSAAGTCAAAPAGAVTIAAAATTVTVATTAVTANSNIIITENSSATMGTRLSVTCNATAGRTYSVTTVTAGTSFVITSSAAPAANPACLSYWIVD